jgi:dienelactone hydrolase
MLTRLVVLLLFAPLCLPAQQPAEAQVAFPEGSLGYFYSEPGPSSEPAPLLVALPSPFERDPARSTWEGWQAAARARGWRVVVPWGKYTGTAAWGDSTVRMLEAVLDDARKRLPTDPSRVYLVGRQESAPLAFYAASRAPGSITAALAIGGSPKNAIDTNRLFGVNTSLVPVLWVTAPSNQEDAALLRQKLTAAGFSLAVRTATEFSPGEAMDWFSGIRREPFQVKVDCETGNLGFARCHWVEITKFDAAMRNDALLSTRVTPGSGAHLDLGDFGFKPSAPGPGVLVEWLPEKYGGPLKLGDRIVALTGRPIDNARAYREMLDEVKEEKPASIIVQRGKERLRLETRIILPKLQELLTARVQAEYSLETRELWVATSRVAGLRLDLPPYWIPARVNWNGTDMGTADQAGCWTLAAGAQARPCGK